MDTLTIRGTAGTLRLFASGASSILAAVLAAAFRFALILEIDRKDLATTDFNLREFL